MTQRPTESPLKSLPGELYRAFFQQSPLGMFVYDRALRLTDFNARLSEILRVPVEALAGFDLNRVSDRALLDAMRASLDGESVTWEGCYTSTLSGHRVEGRTAISPLRDASGAVVGGIAITEDLGAARAAAEIERRRLRATIEALPVGVWVSDESGRILVSNRETARFNGASQPLPREEWPLTRALRGDKAIPFEHLEVRTKDGQEIVALASAAPVHGENGALIGGVAVTVDVTEKRRVHQERERLLAAVEFERKRLTEAFEQIPAILVVTRGPEHVIDAINPFARMMAPQRAAPGRRILDILPELEAQGFGALLDTVYRIGQPWAARAVPVMLEAPGETSRLHYLDLVYQPLVEQEGTCSGILIHGVDVTFQETSKRALEESERRNRAQFQAVPVPTYAWRRGDDGEMRLLDFNDAAKAITRGRIAQVGGATATELFGAGSQICEDLERCFATGQTIRRDLEHRLRTTDEVKRLSVTYVPMAPDMVLAHTEDITERVQLSQQLQQAQKMEAVGRLAGGIAHDFNNLLAVIRISLDFFVEEYGRASEELDEIRRAVERAAALTGQLLAFSRKQVMQPRLVDVNRVVDGMTKMLERLIGEDIRTVRCFAKEPWSVRVDPTQLEQVILNLAINARDAMDRGGELTISTENVLHDGAQMVALRVADTGRGMDEATRAKIFEPFFTTKMRGRGTGLGLSTVYGIVQQSGGQIVVESKPGAGSTFTVLLPRAEGAEARAHEPQPRTAHRSATILLAEDESGVRSLSKRLLERAGYTVLEAHDGEHALEVAARHAGRIDLLVTDVVMPRLGGRQLYEALGTSRPGLRVLYMSGYTDDEILRRGALDAGTAFVQKPFSVQALESAVRGILMERQIAADDHAAGGAVHRDVDRRGES